MGISTLRNRLKKISNKDNLEDTAFIKFWIKALSYPQFEDVSPELKEEFISMLKQDYNL